MSAVVDTPRTGAAPLTPWEPEDAAFWERTGARIARRNLVFSVLSEHIGFSVWSLWSVLVLFLGPEYHIDVAGKFTLTALPTALGAALRLPYTFAVGRFGGRNWTVISALLLLLPTTLAALVLTPGVSYGTLLAVACVAGVGGGNFASSMANINAFYPHRLKGWALGINAGGGNLGVPAVQLLGLLVLATAGAAHPACCRCSTCRSSCSPRRAPGHGWTTWPPRRGVRAGPCARWPATRTAGPSPPSTSAPSARSSASASPSARCSRCSSTTASTPR